MPVRAPTRQQDTAEAVDGQARKNAIAKAVGIADPAHLHIALEALGLQHLKNMGSDLGTMAQGAQSAAEPVAPEELPNPATAADASVPGGLGNQQMWQGVSQQMLQQLNQNLPTNQMAQQMLQQERVQNDPVNQLKNFLAAAQGLGDRGGLHPTNPLSLQYNPNGR